MLALLPIAGAALGGLEGYRRSGGDLGAAALAAGLGAAAPAGLRMAGTALGGTALGARALAAGTKAMEPLARAAQGAAIKAGLGPVAPIGALTAAGLGGATAALGLPVATDIAGGIGAGAKRFAGRILPTAGQATGTGEVVRGYMDRKTGEFVPDPTSPLGATGLPTGPQTALDYLDPTKGYQGQLALQQQQQELALRGATAGMAAMRPYLEEAKTRDFTRSAAAARLANDLATQSGLILGGQQIAGTMGTQALGEVGAGLRTQYRYL